MRQADDAQGQEKAASARGGVDAVDRALGLLRVFTAVEPTLSLTELSARTGLYKSTVLRLAASLEDAGFLVRRADKRYSLGVEVMRLAALFARSFRLDEHVRPVLRHLLEVTGESASFYRREGESRLCLLREDSAQAIRDHVREGDMLPLPIGAAGRVLVWYSDGGEPPNGSVLPVVSLGERDPETAAAAVPVFSHDNLAGALGVSGPRSRFTVERVDAMRQPLVDAGARLSGLLGGHELWSQRHTAPVKRASRR